MRELTTELEIDRPTVVVVIAAHPRQLKSLSFGDLERTGVRVLELVGLRQEDLHERFATYDGTGMVVVDLRPSDGPRQLRTLKQMFFHLADGDIWVGRRSVREPQDPREPLVRFGRRRQRRGPGDGSTEREPLKSIRRVRITPEYVALEKSRSHLLKIRDEGATALLNEREPGLGVVDIAVLPGGTLTPHGTMTDHGSATAGPFPDLIDYPAAHLRRYEGAVWIPEASVAIHGRSILPDSFRWHLSTHPVNRGVRNLNVRFAVPKPRPAGEHLEGPHYFFCYHNPGHFGHLMTEALSKLWGWDAARAADPDVKLLCREHPRRPGSAAKRLEHILLPAYGIPPDQVAWATRPVTVDRLYGATPLWHNAPPFYAHPAFREDWERLRRGLPKATVDPAPKLFITRPPTGKNRACRNVGEVEGIFARHGFRIVRPETLPIPEQAALFAQARVVAGFGGSGMFSLCYSEHLETVIVLNQASYQARNEHLYAALLGVDSHFFWSEPEGVQGTEPHESHQATWRFDANQHKAPLSQLLTTS